MSPVELLAYQMEWAAKDTAHNLDFIPEERLTWKPAESAKSVLDLVTEMAGVALGMAPVLRGESWTFIAPDPIPTDRESARQTLLAAAAEYRRALEEVTPEAMQRPIDLGFAELPFLRAAGLPVVEYIHHRGQIIYIQTLLGDTEDHFDMSAI
jgi:hypothetical protein